MDSEYIETAVSVMRSQGIRFGSGLTEDEIKTAEAVHGFRFPPDLRRLLECALPVGDRFPDWRDPASSVIKDQLSWPTEGICFDVEQNTFWLPAWGPQPEAIDAAHAIVRRAVQEAPFLIPIVGHRYLPATPCEVGNPVFSVYQTDIIHYGMDLPSYLLAEFKVPSPFPVPGTPREIVFWSELVRLNE